MVAADEAAAFLDLFPRLLAEVDIVVLSESLPPGLSDDYDARLIALAHAVGVPVALAPATCGRRARQVTTPATSAQRAMVNWGHG